MSNPEQSPQPERPTRAEELAAAYREFLEAHLADDIPPEEPFTYWDPEAESPYVADGAETLTDPETGDKIPNPAYLTQDDAGAHNILADRTMPSAEDSVVGQMPFGPGLLKAIHARLVMGARDNPEASRSFDYLVMTFGLDGHGERTRDELMRYFGLSSRELANLRKNTMDSIYGTVSLYIRQQGVRWKTFPALTDHSRRH